MQQQHHAPHRRGLRTGMISAAIAALIAAAAVAVAYTRKESTRTIPGITDPGPYRAAKIRPTMAPEKQREAVLRYYENWKKNFVKQACGDDAYQVVSPDAAYPFVAEGQGYGLVITASMASLDSEAKNVFDGILHYVLEHPSTNNADLTAAEQDSSCVDAGGGNSATDGDMDIAYGLLLADKQWGSNGSINYAQLAIKRIAAIKRSEVHPTTKLMLLGDWSTAQDGDLYQTSRTSDWIAHHFRVFRAATGDPFWDDVLRAHQTAIASLQSAVSPVTGLLPDFAQVSGNTLRPADGKVLESPRDGDYYFNACRTPWRIGLDAVTSADNTSLTAALKINKWAVRTTGGDPDRFAAGYTLDGERLQDSGSSNTFWAPLAVAAMTDPTSQAWLDALWQKMATTPVSPDAYFGTTIQLQVMLIVSGLYTPL
jgi:endo-1,4-beta-D-glucanase Y